MKFDFVEKYAMAILNVQTRGWTTLIAMKEKVPNTPKSPIPHFKDQLTPNFLRGHLFWAYEWFQSGGSQEGHNGYYCVPHEKLLLLAMIPLLVWRDGYSQEISKLKNEPTISFVDTLLHITPTYYYLFKFENCQFYVDSFSYLKCISFPQYNLESLDFTFLHMCLSQFLDF